MSVRCLITDGKNYEQNKQFVEDTLKYFPDYDFNSMKATISGWQSSQLKDSEDRLPTIQELISYLQDSAKRENNNSIKIIADKAQQILNNLSAYDKKLQDILANAPRDSQGRLLAPNGKPSNLTERQYAQVRTKEFKEWFGDWERRATNFLGESTGNIDIADIINADGSINFKVLEEITDEYFNNADEALFNKGRKTLRQRREKHYDGNGNLIENNTLEHLQNVTKSALASNIRPDLKPQLILAAALHDLAKPFHGGQIHGFQSLNLVNKLFKGNISPLVKFAIKHHMLTTEENKKFSIDDATRIMQEALDNNLNLDDAIEILLAINTADILSGQSEDSIDYYSKKSKRDTINEEIPFKKSLLVQAKNKLNDVSKVVDENGEPLIVYHGTKSLEEFSEFDKDTAIYTTDELLMGVSYVPDELYEYVGKLTEGSNTKEVLDVLYYFTSQLKKGEPFDYLNSNYTALKEALEPLGITVEEKSTYTLEDLEKYKNLVKATNIPIKLARGVDAFVKPLFGKIKNPLIIDAKGAMWNKILFNGKIYSTRELEQLYRNTEYDGIIIKNVLDYGGAGSLPSTVYIQYNSNQIKSATDNIGAFSTTNNDIYDSKMQQQSTQPTVTKIISGGQTGVDTIGLQVARELGIETGGIAPKGFLREKGIDDEDISSYNLVEITDEEQADYTKRKGKSDPYTGRTELNVRNSDGTVYFYTSDDKVGMLATKRSAEDWNKPFITNPTAEQLKQWLIDNNIRTLNVAGNRGSKLDKNNNVAKILREALISNSQTQQQIQPESQPITTEQLNEPQQFNEEKIKATRDFLNPVTRKQVVQKIARMFSNIVSKEYNNQKQALDNRIANETDDKIKKELLFQRRKFNRFQVIKTMTPVAIFNKLKETYEKYVSLTDEQGKNLEKTMLNKNSVFQKMPDTQKDRIAQIRFNNKKKAYQLILDNFKILAMEASKSFALTEGVNLTFNNNMVTQLQEQDTYDDEGNSDVAENKEEKGREHWMIDVRTVSSFNSLTNKIRQAINNIARVTKDGIQEVDDMGDTIYLSGSYVHSELIKTLAAEITDPNDIIPILQKAAVRKPWINQIIYKIQDDPILFTEMYRAYNKSTLNYWIQKPRTQQDGSIKTQTISLNKIEGMDQLFETWRDNYEYGNKLEDGAVYTSNGTIIKNNVKKGLDLVNEVKNDIYYHRKDTRETRVAIVLNKDNVLKLTKAFKMLGIPLEEQTVAEAIGYNIDNTQYEPDFNAYTLINALVTIYDDLLKNKEVKEDEQFDMANAYGRALETVAKVISFVTEDTMESQVRHNKKSLYSHVNSGYMINLIKKLKNPDKFKDFIEKEYMPVEWFYKNGQWRNQFIKNLYNNQEDRDKLQHIVMLDYNGKEYADWSTLDSTLVLINQFFSQPTKDEHGWAYYNIPVLSDTESAEFLRMRRYINNFEDIINTKFINLVKQEIDRIDLVKRRANDPNVEKIANFDMVKTVDKNGNEHIKYGGAEFKFFPELNFIQVNGKSFLDEYYRLSQTETADKVNQFIKDQISSILERRFKTALKNWDKIGLFERVDDNPNGKFKYFDTNSRTTAEQLLKQWYWNSSFAQSQIIELLTTDLAFYKTKGKDFLTDFIKRAKEFHAPIERLNTEAEWIVNGERKKVCYDDNGNKLKNRVLYLKDCVVPSLTLEELKEALDKNPKLTKEEKGIIIGAYQNINMADAQAYRTLDSFRRTQIMAGQWSDDEETAYNNIKNGNFRLEDITVLWNTRKPYLYTQTNQSNQVDNGNIRVPVQHKNSEMIMLTQAILGTIMSTGKLAALERFMTKNNIDVVMFESAVKAGGQDIIDLNNIEANEVENYLTDYVNTYSQAIHEFDYEDYGIQTATPEHGIDAMQLVGTQIRRIIASNQDMTDPNFRFKYKDKEWTVQEWQDYYNMVNTANIRESLEQLDKKFSDIKEIEKLLLSEVRSNPRYDTDVEMALTLNSDGIFNIPLLDPSITYKIQSLLTSIVKNRVTKQKIAGGAFIQTSAWGFKREPKVIYNEDGSVKYIECYMPCPSEELYNMLLDDKTHEVDINKKYKGKDGKWHYIVPEKYRELIGYRVPTESFYSCAPLKVIGYLPRQCGTIMVVPRDIVSMAGSDFDKL